MGKKSAPPAPPAVDAAKASGEYLFGKGFANYQGVTDPALQERLLKAEQTYRPQYAALELADINAYLLGTQGQQGVLDLTAEATRRSAALDREAQALQRQQEVDILGKYGQQTVDALRGADPYSRQIAEAQQQYAADLFAKSGTLSMEDQRAAEQMARQQGMASGRIGDSSTVAAQALNRQNALAQRSAMAQQAGAQAFGYNRALAGDVANILIGRPATAYAMGSQAFGQGAGLAGQPTGPQLFDPNAGINLALQNSSNLGNYQASTYGAKVGAQGAIIGGALSAIGSIGGAAGFAAAGGCWVAREVYGEDNPKWKVFRRWLSTKAPLWLFSLYCKHGERFAAFIKNKPAIKWVIRKLMDLAIKGQE
jgi:hypothetical protein